MFKGTLFALAVCFLSCNTHVIAKDLVAEKLTASAILKKVEATYAAMQSYKSEGMIKVDMQTNGMNVKMETSFIILLKKPNQYLISWKQNNFPMPGMSSSGAVWSDGTQPFYYMGMGRVGADSSYTKLANDALALGAATGVSGGAAHTIPSRFFMDLTEGLVQAFSTLVDPQIEKSEQIDKEDCYLISGSSKAFKRESFWISKSRYLILKFSRSMEPPEGGRKTPEMTDKQIEEAIRGMGQEVTAESIEKMRNMMESAAKMIKTMDIKGESTESQQNISSPKLEASDFLFELPEDAVFKKSMLDGLPEEMPEIE